jgi:HEAT repeat protein
MPLVKRRAPSRPPCGADALDSADPTARRAAALALAGNPDAAAPLLDTLGREPVPEVRVAIVTSLMATRTEAVAAGLTALLRSQDVALRNDAIEALRQMGEAARAPLTTALNDTDPDMRLFAVNALDHARAPWARDCLHRVLAEDPEVNVGLAAVDALATTGAAEDAPMLAAFAARFPDEPMVAFAVRTALRRLGSASA